MIAIVFGLTLTGSALLCLSMRRNWERVLPNRNYPRPWAIGLRTVGYLLLLIAVIQSSMSHGAGVGIALFLGLLTVAVLGIAVVLPYWR